MDSEESAALRAAVMAFEHAGFERADMVGADGRAEAIALRCVDARSALELVLRALHCDETREQLERELRAELVDFTDLTVELDFYENAPLLLREPRQRTKLVRYVVEQARKLVLSDDDETSIDWRSATALVATKSVCLRRSLGPRLGRLDPERARTALAIAAAECGRVQEQALDGMHVLLVNRRGLTNGACAIGEVD